MARDDMFKTLRSDVPSRGLAVLLLGASLLAAGPALAHNAIISCFDNEDGTITCEAGYSDGASSAGQVIRVREANSRLIVEGVFDKSGSYKFKKPVVRFIVEFIGDLSHSATFDGDDLDN